MKICAVVCEFNPFHNGHKYMLRQARDITGCDVILCIMSGNFVQRCEPAVIDKTFRTHHALCGGADIVAELPVMYATANADCFAAGAVEIIKSMRGVTHIAFGCETPDINIIRSIAKIRLDESDEFKRNLKNFLSDGDPYPSAHSKATLIECEKLGLNTVMCDKVLKMPNNLLAIEYCKQILKQAPDIETVPIERKGARHNEDIVRENYSSAESIRKKVFAKDFTKIESTVPPDCFEDLKMQPKPDITLFKQLILYKLRTGELCNLFDSGEGVEIKLKKHALETNSLDKATELTKSKRYTRARINRLCLQALLGIYKNSLFADPSVPVRLLGIKKECKPLIGAICDSLLITNSDINSIAATHREYIRTEESAAAVYAQLTGSNYSMYAHKLIEV